MTPIEEDRQVDAYLQARKNRITARAAYDATVCEEQRLLHLLHRRWQSEDDGA